MLCTLYKRCALQLCSMEFELINTKETLSPWSKLSRWNAFVELLSRRKCHFLLLFFCLKRKKRMKKTQVCFVFICSNVSCSSVVRWRALHLKACEADDAFKQIQFNVFVWRVTSIHSTSTQSFPFCFSPGPLPLTSHSSFNTFQKRHFPSPSLFTHCTVKECSLFWFWFISWIWSHLAAIKRQKRFLMKNTHKYDMKRAHLICITLLWLWEYSIETTIRRQRRKKRRWLLCALSFNKF